ncbi:hypothetical protein BGZ81_002515 [Podila clonocystis]|nr:hypothetical protein BGZ81_002515 [Podila clonocystis]
MPSSNTSEGWSFEINLDAMEQEASSHIRDLRDTMTKSQNSDNDDDDIWYTEPDKVRPGYSDRDDNHSNSRRSSLTTGKGNGRADRRNFSQDTRTTPTDDAWGVGTAWPAPRRGLSQGSDNEESLDAITAYWATDPNTQDLIRSSKRKKPKPPTTTFLRQHHLETDSWGDAPQGIRPYGHDPSDGLVEQQKQEFWSQDEQGRWYLLNNTNPSQATIQRAMTMTPTTTTTAYTSLERRSVEGSTERRSMEGSVQCHSLGLIEHGPGEGSEIQVYRSDNDERESEGDYEEGNEDNYDNDWRDYGETQIVRTDVPKKLPRSEGSFSFSDGSDMPQPHYRPEQQHKYEVEWLSEEQWKTPRGRAIQPPKEDDLWEMANTDNLYITQLPEDEGSTHKPSKSPSPLLSPSQASTEDYPDFQARSLSLDFSKAKPYHDDYEQSINLPSDAVSRLPSGLLEADEDDGMVDVGDIAFTRSPPFYPDQKDAQESSLLDLDNEIGITSPVQATTSRSVSSSSLLDMSHEDEAKPTMPLLELIKEPTQEPTRDQESTLRMISLLEQSTCAISLDQECTLARTISVDQKSLIPMVSLDQELDETAPVKLSIPSLLDDLGVLLSMDGDKETTKEPNEEPTDKEPTDKDSDRDSADIKDTLSANHASLIDIEHSIGQGVISPTPKSSQSHFEFGVHSWLDKLGAQNKKFHEESLQTNKQQWDSLMAKQQEDSKKLDDFIQRSTTATTTAILSSAEKQGSANEEVTGLGLASAVTTTTSKKVVKTQTPFSLQVDIETSGCGFQSIHVTERDDIEKLEELVDAFCSRYRMDAYKMAVFASVASAIKRKKKMIKKDRLAAKLAA